VSFTFNTAFQL